MAVTADDARTLGEHDASAATSVDDIDPTLAVSQIAEWVPEEYRQAYLDGAASVLGRAPAVER